MLKAAEGGGQVAELTSGRSVVSPSWPHVSYLSGPRRAYFWCASHQGTDLRAGEK